MLAALRAHDPEKAEAEMRQHIEEPGDWIRDAAIREQASRENQKKKRKAKEAIG